MRNSLIISILLYTLLAPDRRLTGGSLLHQKGQVRGAVKARLLAINAMKARLLFFLLILHGAHATAQIATVRSQEDSQPLELATLISESPRAFAMTNARGQADVAPFGGAMEIEIRLIGYEPKRLSYTELEAQNFEVYLNATNFSLDQVVVSASKWEQTRRQTPARVAAITAREVALYNPQTAADLLGASGEVFIQKSQQGGGSPMIRGFATNRLLIAVDGVRMNTAIFRSGNLQNVISLDPFAVERTEVLFGPGSVLYGSDAIGGVMSFYTLAPQTALEEAPFVKGGGALRYTSANEELSGHFDVNVGWKKWALLTSFSHNRYGDLRMGRYGPDDYLRPEYVQRIDNEDRVVSNEDPLVQRPTGYSQTNLMQKLRYRPNEQWDLTYAFHYSATTDYGRYDRLLRYRNGRPRSAEWCYGPQTWMMNNLRITHQHRRGLYDELAINLAHQHFEESRIDRDFGDNERRTRLEKVDAWSANADFKKRLGNQHQLLYGLEAILNDVSSTGTDESIITGALQPGPARYPQAAWGSYAAYLTYRWQAAERWLLLAGARYNRFTLDAEFDTTFYPFPFTTATLDEGALTGSMGAVFTPGGDWSFSANLATGFRAPNVDDVGKVFDSEPGSVVVPNPGLQAEYAYNAEIGVAKVFGQVLEFELSAFYTLLDDALVRRNFTLNGQDSIVYDGELSQVQAIQNAARATVWGIQAEIEVDLPAGFSLLGRFTYQQGEEEVDDGAISSLRHAAPPFGLARLSYRTAGLRLDLSGHFYSGFSFEELPQEERSKDFLYAADADGNPYAPSWYILNFNALCEVSEQFSIGAGVENLTDRRYRPYSSGLAGAGRSFVLSGRVRF